MEPVNFAIDHDSVVIRTVTGRGLPPLVRSWENDVGCVLEAVMSKSTGWVVGGVAAGVVVFLLLPGWLKVLAVVALVGVPTVGYLMLDPSQRRRLRERRRRQIGP